MRRSGLSLIVLFGLGVLTGACDYAPWETPPAGPGSSVPPNPTGVCPDVRGLWTVTRTFSSASVTTCGAATLASTGGNATNYTLKMTQEACQVQAVLTNTETGLSLLFGGALGSSSTETSSLHLGSLSIPYPTQEVRCATGERWIVTPIRPEITADYAQDKYTGTMTEEGGVSEPATGAKASGYAVIRYSVLITR